MSSATGPLPVRTIVFLAAASFASAVSLRACDPILPDLAAAFSTTPGDAAKVITFFGGAYALAQFVYGFVGDRFGLLRVVAITTVLSGISSIFCAVAGTLDALVIARIAVGSTAAAIIPLAMAWLGEVVPYERRQSVLAYFITGQISGIVLGQTFAGIIAEHLGWRYVFVAIAACFIVAGIALLAELYRVRDAVSSAERNAEPAIARLAVMLRQPWVAIVLAAAFFEGMVFFGAYTFVGSFLRAEFALSYDVIGLIVAGFGIGGLLYAASARHMLPRLGETGFMLWGGVLVAISFVAITISPSALFVVPATVLAGFSYYMIHNTLQTHATQMAPASRGLAVSTFACSLFLGQAIGVAVAAPACDYTGGAPIFLTAAVLLLGFGILFRSLLTRRS
jgi:MFS transporter, YNFM family, putative membrane transport protein